MDNNALQNTRYVLNGRSSDKENGRCRSKTCHSKTIAVNWRIDILPASAYNLWKLSRICFDTYDFKRTQRRPVRNKLGMAGPNRLKFNKSATSPSDLYVQK
jgi:hypothetical protein